MIPSSSPTTIDISPLVSRSLLLQKTRSFFYDRHFIEVQTPCIVQSAGTDPSLAPLSVPFSRPGDHSPTLHGQLRTSPELEMKRLLVAGLERIFQIGPAFRDHELSPLHNPEFTLLEWYHAHQHINDLIQDLETLVVSLLPSSLQLPGFPSPIPLQTPFPRIPLSEAILLTCGFDIRDCPTTELLRSAISQFTNLSPDPLADWNELFSLILIDKIDPWLRSQALSSPYHSAIFLTEWPANAAILAELTPHDPRVAQRFELYIAGIEIANGFGELTDPIEQERRFLDEIAYRKAQGLPSGILPSLFLDDLRKGLPPSSGVAVGFDRLCMLHRGDPSLLPTLPFGIQRTNPEEGPSSWAFR